MDDEIYYYFLKNGDKRFMYRHKYYDVLGKRKEKKKSGFRTEKEALRSLLQVKADLLDGQVKKVESGQMTVAQWMDIWYETYKNGWEVTSQVLRKSVIEDHIKPLIGRYRLNKLDRTTYIREFINKLLKDYESSSVYSYHALFKSAINAAVEDELISRNRISKINIEKNDKLDNFLNPKELNLFLNYSKKYLTITGYTLIHLLAYTGLRRGEALGLKWKNINFEKSTITVERTRDYYGERAPKTKSSNRTIKVDDYLVDLLRIYKKWCIETKFKFGMQLDKKNDLVFISYQGGMPCTGNYAVYVFESLYNHLKKNNIKIKKITPHGLRHTHATILINNQVPPKTIADRLGNTVEMIYNVYSHAFEDLEDKAVLAFNESLSSGAKFGAK